MTGSVRPIAASMTIALLVSFSCEKAKDTQAESNPSGPSADVSPVFNIDTPPAGHTIVLPIEFSGDLATIAAEINGQPAKLLIDTAAGTMCIFQDKLDKFGLKVVGTGTGGYSASGFHRAPICSTYTVKLKRSLRIEVINGAVLPVFPSDSTIDGIIGNPVIISLKGKLDYADKTLTLNQ